MDEFNKWCRVKEYLHENRKEVFVKEREIWWSALGYNVGHEENGKHKLYERPILVLKKINKSLFLGLPTTTKYKGEFYKDYVGTYNHKKIYVIWTQVRILSTRRLLRKSSVIVLRDKFERIKQKFIRYIK